jgi:hypothetical protein
MVRAYALVEIGDPKAVDVFLRPEDAFAALEDVLGDEPMGQSSLRGPDRARRARHVDQLGTVPGPESIEAARSRRGHLGH